MLKLYYAPGACSLAAHIALKEARLEAQYIKVDLRDKTTSGGEDFRCVSRNGYVPVLVMPDGQVLTEGPAIVQYIADQVPGKRLAPPAGTLDRYRLMQWLNFISTELHTSFGMLFDPSAAEPCKMRSREKLRRRLRYVEDHLVGGSWLLGEDCTVADAYLFTVLRWADHLDVDLSACSNLQDYRRRMHERPAVRDALVEEGLLLAPT